MHIRAFEMEKEQSKMKSKQDSKNESIFIQNEINNCEFCGANTSISYFREYIGNPLAFIYLFYNKLSGGNIETYFTKYLKEIVLDVDGIITHMNFVDMISDMEFGINRVKNSLKITNKDVCIVGVGGDGSFSTLVNTFLETIPEHKDRLIFAVLPFGTGNDWARSFGWSSYGNMKFMKDDFSPLIDLARGIFTSNLINFDTWMVEVEIYDREDSSFQRVNPNTQELERVNNSNDENKKLLVLKKRCINYFSFGEESRVGITFDTYRKKNVLLNRALYGLAGSMFTVNNKYQSNIPLSHSTRKIYLVDPKSSNQETCNQECGLCPKGTIHSSEDAQENSICPTLLSSVSLVFLNIETFGGGVKLWKNSKNIAPSIIKASSNLNFGGMVGNLSSFLINPISLDFDTFKQVKSRELREDTESSSESESYTNHKFDSESEINFDSDKSILDPKESDINSLSEVQNNDVINSNQGDQIQKTIEDEILKIVPDSSDRKLEIMSFSGLMDFSSIFLPYMSTAKKVGQFSPFQTGSPHSCEDKLSPKVSDLKVQNSTESSNYCKNQGKTLKMEFYDKNNSEYQSSLIEVYFQIDGEYYFAKEPKQCSVNYDQKIKVLKCIIPYSPFKNIH
ncbi:diacylglycerol kinase variant A [Cryptosporidium ubiquitum]|uniref:diacylglycerol kinase (ATP) n=1 Tax=Cryptosporidium ubiquitum TaxID=857276 RepID=A0A1J4MJN3_9CRYT|nr:diacylglycerol kinase variant A [Cryptosporidium ubiquitum]OII73667.1 diacylglycerol kinase variant A [Cryptosporidium ubiquitum]